MLHRFLIGFKPRPKTLVGVLAMVALANQLSVVALAAGSPASSSLTSVPSQQIVCSGSTELTQECGANGGDSLQVTLPDGGRPCPGSELAACEPGAPSPKPTPGIASTPTGQAACAPSGPAACTETTLPAPDALLASQQTDGGGAPIVNPSVPAQSLGQVVPQPRVQLTASANAVKPAQSVLLTATAGTSVTGSGNVIEIFDQTTGTLVGSCEQGSQCVVAYAAKSGSHTFAAFVTTPTSRLPVAGTAARSNLATVSWISVSVVAKNPVVGPGMTITVTATSTARIDKSGYELQLFDASAKTRLASCNQGINCSISLTQSAGGVRSVVAVLANLASTLPAPSTQATSETLALTWLTASVEGHAIGSTVHLTARTNIDLTNTPWSLGIYDDHGHLISQPCKSGSTCSGDLNVAGEMPRFNAAVGTVPVIDSVTNVGKLVSKVVGPASLVNVQVRSDAVRPVRMLWGVDSCKSFTSDPNAGNGLYPQVAGRLGTPDFWGRYLTQTICPGISGAEIAAAHNRQMGILPIYNDYNCSNVVGYDTGKSYAAEAVAAATRLGIPQGRGLAIDIEPPGDACPGAANVESGFIHGWYDGITDAHYVPIFYANATPGSEFASQWCYTVSVVPEIGQRSYLWTFEPSLLGRYTKGSAPGYTPETPGCPGLVTAWQYQISAGSDPDVDHDLATSDLPLWYP